MYARGEGHDHDSVRTRSVLPDHTWTEGPLRTINRAVCRWPLSLVVLLVLAAPVAPNVPITRLSDPNPWSPAGHMAVGRAFPTATLLPNGTVLVAGGAGTSGRPLASAELYEPRTGHWTMTGRMVSGCYSCTATPLSDGRVLVTGGFGSKAVLASAELYDPHTGTWTATGRMVAARASHNATLLADGRVLVTGGVDSSFAPLDSAELYDPHTGTWTATGRMAVARQAQTETLLRDGRVLVAGGATGAFGTGPAIASAELYNPHTGRWTTTAPMARPRLGAVDTLLPSGDVLIVGGLSGQAPSSGVLSSAELFEPRTGTWRSAGLLAQGRINQSDTLLPDGRVLVAGGVAEYFAGPALSSAEVYVPRTDTWTPAGHLIAARQGHAAVLLPNGDVLVSGGQTSFSSAPFTSAELYNPHIGAGTVAVTRARAFHTATLLANGQVLVTGGLYGSLLHAEYRSSTELYDPHTGTWTVADNMSVLRWAHTATVLFDGRILVAGGYDDSDTPLRSAELYDPRTGRWTATGAMITARAGHTATLLPNGDVLVSGGQGPSRSFLASAELYNPHTGRWAATGRMIVARVGQTATLLPDGHVLVAGGSSGTSNPAVDSAELYDPRTGRWAATGRLATARTLHKAILLPNGRVLVAGGQTRLAGLTVLLADAEVYNPRTGRWTPAGAMAHEREQFTMTLLADGHILVAGGVGNTSPLADAELYDPRTGRWASTGRMLAARAFHSATRLPHGTVLVAGGYDASRSTLSGAELYDPHTGRWTATGHM